MDKIDLSEVCQNYRARVIRVTPLDDCYLLETNRGPKELHVWPRIDVMRWSFAWRERLARQGFREVERFIRTRESKPYVLVGKQGVTMTDHVRKLEVFHPERDTAYQSGRVVAMMHLSQQESNLLAGADYLRQEQMKAETEWTRAKSLFESYRAKFAKEKGEKRWVGSLMQPLLQRMERSVTMLGDDRIAADVLSVSHKDLMPDNWGLANGRLHLRGFFRPALSVQQRDVAGYLRHLYLTQLDLSQVDAFLDGYEEVKPLTREDYTLMLAFMARPREIWRSVEAYVNRVSKNKEMPITGIEQAIKSQQSVDVLLRHIADRAERPRSESANEPL
ncbi:phosphotransferase [Brevibacillus nitrificans]|uniref:phosphotransferase n=1 Tax=Brevibacillus nitrificans TaxID=651560 RepID=UPI002E1C05E4|nr:phosphotransferase [Brevibacillus nitrificans]